MLKGNDDVYSTIRQWRRMLNEGMDDSRGDDKETNEGVPYTMQDELMQSITQTAKSQFGANFSQTKTPMIYYPEGNGESENVIISGTVSSLNDAKFQFKWKDNVGTGCYIWTSPLNLSEKILSTLNVIYGVYENWQKELDNAEDVKPMNLKNQEAGNEGYVPSIPTGNF